MKTKYPKTDYEKQFPVKIFNSLNYVKINTKAVEEKKFVQL